MPCNRCPKVSTSTSSQSNLAKAASKLWGKLGTPSNTMLLEPSGFSNPHRMLIHAAAFAGCKCSADRLTDMP